MDQPLEQQLALNEAARAAGARFVACASRGVFGALFCDLGDTFTATDADGEPVKEALLRSVAAAGGAGELEVRTVAEQPHGLSEGDCVKLTELQDGAPCEPGRVFSVSVVDRHTLRLAAADGGAPPAAAAAAA